MHSVLNACSQMQGHNTAMPWAPPPDLIGGSQQYIGGVPAPQTNGGAPPWGSAAGNRAGYGNDAGYAPQYAQQQYYSQPQYQQQQYNAQDPYGQQYQQQQYWDQAQAAGYGYAGYGTQPGYDAQYGYPQQQQQHYAAPQQQPAPVNNPYAQMYGQHWSQGSQTTYGAPQLPQAGPPSGYGISYGAPPQQVRLICRQQQTQSL